jgi:hypothetical protein
VKKLREFGKSAVKTPMVGKNNDNSPIVGNIDEKN